MCKFCEFEPGDSVTIKMHEYKTMLGNEVRNENRYRVYLYANDNDEPDYYIVSDHYDMRSGHDHDSIEIPIHYCPFCGRKLHNVESLI